MDAWYHDVVSLITAKIDHFSVPGFLWNGTNDHTLTYQRLGTPRHPGSGPTPDILRVGPMSIWEPLPDKLEQKFKKKKTPESLPPWEHFDHGSDPPTPPTSGWAP